MLAQRESYAAKLSLTIRAILVDWLVDVTVEYWLYDETLHLAVRLLDSFISTCAEVSLSSYHTLMVYFSIISQYRRIFTHIIKLMCYI
jgi:hypothetical protein